MIFHYKQKTAHSDCTVCFVFGRYCTFRLYCVFCIWKVLHIQIVLCVLYLEGTYFILTVL